MYNILIPPLAGALIGWFTNYVAVKMLFRPYEPVNIFGYRLQGIIPKRRKEIAKTIAKTIENELLNAKDFSKILECIEWKAEVEKAVDEIIEHRFKATRIKSLPIIGLLSENLLYHIKYYLTKEALKHIDEKKGELVNNFQEKIDIKDMLVSKIDNLNLEQFEALLIKFIAKELKHIEWIGGALGFVIGCAQVVISLTLYT
ncbi:MAG: DUF445 family protein [Deltaproteobacteria bacterium]|nr:DUF445 family protein [Deltaproteobacteria bacterium]